MINIELVKELNEEGYKFIGEGFNKYAETKGVICDYKPFNFVAKDGEKIIGIITGHSYYSEVYIGDLIVLEEYRNQHVGSKLMNMVESYYKDKGFENMNLTTYGFQAPEFYKKCGFEIEYVRENKTNPKLSKYIMVKYF